MTREFNMPGEIRIRGQYTH